MKGLKRNGCISIKTDIGFYGRKLKKSNKLNIFKDLFIDEIKWIKNEKL